MTTIWDQFTDIWTKLKEEKPLSEEEIAFLHLIQTSPIADRETRAEAIEILEFIGQAKTSTTLNLSTMYRQSQLAKKYGWLTIPVVDNNRIQRQLRK